MRKFRSTTPLRQNVRMKSLFQPPDNAELVKRIQTLRADAKATWGKMSVAQMLQRTKER